MHGLYAQMIQVPHTRMAIPDPVRILHLVIPILAVVALWWLVNRTEQIIHFLFPTLEWEKSLGWLNIKAERRAKSAIRWIGYLIKLALAVALYAIVRLADIFPDLGGWPDPHVTASLLVCVPGLVACLGFWVVYLGFYLVPKIHAEREEAELKRFRRDMEAAELEHEQLTAKSRIDIALPKPRTDPPLASSMPLRPRRRDLPGG